MHTQQGLRTLPHIPELANAVNCVPDVPEIYKAPRTKNDSYLHKPTKRKNAKEQKNLEQKEVAMFFFCALEPGVGEIHQSLLGWAGSCKSEFLKGWL